MNIRKIIKEEIDDFGWVEEVEVPEVGKNFIVKHLPRRVFTIVKMDGTNVICMVGGKGYKRLIPIKEFMEDVEEGLVEYVDLPVD